MQHYDAEIYRDGYKMGRGGKCNQMFKGNERTPRDRYGTRSARRRGFIEKKKKKRKSKRYNEKKEENCNNARLVRIKTERYAANENIYYDPRFDHYLAHDENDSAEYSAIGLQESRVALKKVSWRRNGYIYANDNYEQLSFSKKDTRFFRKNKDAVVKECQICCEIRPLVPLLKKCNHAPVCHVCLREIYVNQAQQNVLNYPLQCYHPSCRKQIHDVHLVKHNLIFSEKELTKHYRLKVLGKAYSGSRDIVHCPQCEFPKIVNKQSRVVSCRQCKVTYEVEDDIHNTRLTTIAAIESIRSDKMGSNDGWAQCPRCKIIISKGDGCDHMTCVCGLSFSWTEALDKKQTILKSAVKGKINTILV